MNSNIFILDSDSKIYLEIINDDNKLKMISKIENDNIEFFWDKTIRRLWFMI